MNGYNFTERVRRVLAEAREQAAKLQHEYVGTEHMLLGILAEGEGVACTVLENLKVDSDQLRQLIFDTVKRGVAGKTTGPDLPYTSRAKKVLELAMTEARELNHSYVGTEHLLLGLLAEERGIAAQVLTDAGVTLEKAQNEIMRILGSEEVHSKRTARAWAHSALSGSIHGMPYAERLRRVLSAAHDIAARERSFEVTPVHATIALLEHGEGLANAALDVLRFDRESALTSLRGLAAPSAPAAVEPDDALTPSVEFQTVLRGMEMRPTRTTGLGTHDLLLNILKTSPDVVGVFSQQNIAFDTVQSTVNRLVG